MTNINCHKHSIVANNVRRNANSNLKVVFL